jgi:hypothetical protein
MKTVASCIDNTTTMMREAGRSVLWRRKVFCMSHDHEFKISVTVILEVLRLTGFFSSRVHGNRFCVCVCVSLDMMQIY